MPRETSTTPLRSSFTVTDTGTSLGVRESAGIRQAGVFLSREVSLRGHSLVVMDDGRALPTQQRTLARWPDGKPQWVELKFACSVGPVEERELILAAVEGAETPTLGPAESSHSVTGNANGTFTVQTGRASFVVGRTGLIAQASVDGISVLADGGCRLRYANRDGKELTILVDQIAVQKRGPVAAQLRLEGHVRSRPRLGFTAYLDFLHMSALVRLQVSIHNRGRARHGGGYWDLGDSGEISIGEFWLDIPTNLGSQATVEGWDRSDSSCRKSDRLQWHSRAERSPSVGQVPTEADRAPAPTGYVISDAGALGCTVPEFWERAPKSLRFDSNGIRVGLLSGEEEAAVLQAGEKCTEIVWLDFEKPMPDGRLRGVLCPDFVDVHLPESSENPQIAPWLPACWAPREEFAQLAEEALAGPQSFFAKRQDGGEYGWRNFGEVWADHEEAYYDGPKPVTSHYNNQYDLLYGFLVQYLLTRDQRWWRLADPLARHILDVDIYHTDRDKSAYSGGMFWHTAHYHDAGNSTHRSMSREMLGKSVPAPGGGPGNERAKDAVVGLADWVIRMDDGRLHLLGLVSNAPTGLASSTRSPDYHGPGRGAGNSINTLLDGWLASGERRYLLKAEELIHRTIHPQDDIAARDLLNAEERWSYTVHLQALVRYLALTGEVVETDACRQYARESLLHYARWMVEHERLYLDDPGQLEYVTETWAAQDLRKGNVLLMAAAHSNDPLERDRLRRRGEEILDGAWKQLMTFPTRTYTRPLAVALQQGYIEGYFRRPDLNLWNQVTPSLPDCFGLPVPFVPQKQQVRQALRNPVGILRMAANLLRPRPWWNLFRRSWAAEIVRRQIGR